MVDGELGSSLRLQGRAKLGTFRVFTRLTFGHLTLFAVRHKPKWMTVAFSLMTVYRAWPGPRTSLRNVSVILSGVSFNADHVLFPLRFSQSKGVISKSGFLKPKLISSREMTLECGRGGGSELR